MTDCNPHPCAPHGFNRNASHSADEYVCDCEYWEPAQGCEAAMFQARIAELEAENVTRKDWICPETYALTLAAVKSEARRADAAEAENARLRARIAGGVRVDLWLNDENKKVGRYCVLTGNEYDALLPLDGQSVLVITDAAAAGSE